MQKNWNLHNPGKLDPPRSVGRARLKVVLPWHFCVLGICALLGVGCASGGGGSGSLTGIDPLVGEIHPPKPGGFGPNPPGPSASPPKVTQVDPLYGPPNSPPASATALAPTGNSRPTLQINENISTNGFDKSAFTSGFRTPTGNNSPGSVTPLASSGSQPAGAYQPGTPTSEMLQSQLRACGVIWQKLEPLPDGRVCFSCIVPNRYNPESPRSIEATAGDYVSAIQAAIVKINQP